MANAGHGLDALVLAFSRGSIVYSPTEDQSEPNADAEIYNLVMKEALLTLGDNLMRYFLRRNEGA